MPDTQNWVAWALLSASFAALTAIFAKVGLERVDPDYATLVRTAVILLIVAGMVGAMGKWQDPRTIPPRSPVFLGLSGACNGRVLAVLLSRASSRKRLARGAHRQAERRAGRHLRSDRSRRAAITTRLGGDCTGRHRRADVGAEALICLLESRA